MDIRENIFWIGHASFYIKTKAGTIFIDPYKVSSKVKEKADLVLITHAHPDHNSKADLEKVIKPETMFVAPKNCLDPKVYKNLQISKPGFATSFNGILIEAVPAYNINPERLQNHPKSEGWVGYVLEIDGIKIYHAGDTDHIPEMSKIKNIEVALLPMGGTYTMAMDEAIEAAKTIKPKTVIPMHYKILLGEQKSKELEKELKSKLPSAHIMKEVQDPVYSF
jgi:L-ascorbate metabolism protein UlaG (beta-lactamase superfamily)